MLLNKLLKMVNANTADVNFKDSMDFTMLIIDLLTIYLNEHKGSAIMFLSNNLPTKLDITLRSTTLFSSEMLNKMNQKLIIDTQVDLI